MLLFQKILIRLLEDRIRQALTIRARLPQACGSSGLPDLPPGCEFRGTDSIAGEIAFVQAGEFG
jgi:hypothetical protein